MLGAGACNSPAPAPVSDVEAPLKVVFVADGDSIHVRKNGERVKVRLLRIDAPEEQDPFYRESTEALKALLRGKDVRLEFDGATLDEYGRTLAYVRTTDGVLVNEEMVRNGWARVFDRYGVGRYYPQFREAQREARRDGRGIWKMSTGGG